jgi:hypothetical protein
VPLSQGEVLNETGRFLGRVDFYFGDTGVLGEFDGRVRYGRLLRSAEGPADVLVAEQRREEALRDSGFQVVRWTWDELRTGEVAIRVYQAFARARHTRPDGSIRRAALPEPASVLIRPL